MKRTVFFCEKKFIGGKYKTYHKKLGFVNVSDFYCSRNCEKAMRNAIRKCFKGMNLNKKEKLAVKNLKYVYV